MRRSTAAAGKDERRLNQIAPRGIAETHKECLSAAEHAVRIRRWFRGRRHRTARRVWQLPFRADVVRVCVQKPLTFRPLYQVGMAAVEDAAHARTRNPHATLQMCRG